VGCFCNNAVWSAFVSHELMVSFEEGGGLFPFPPGVFPLLLEQFSSNVTAIIEDKNIFIRIIMFL